jgi:hypothetical protein
MDFFELAVTGIGAVQALLLLLVKPDDESLKKDYIQLKVDDYLKKNHIGTGTSHVRHFLTWVLDDQFTIETLNRSENLKYLILLDNLKERLVNFYFNKLSDISTNSGIFDKVCDVDMEIGRLALQVMRMRLVIQPDFQLSKNIHPSTKIKYISAKGIWINDDFTKTRKFTKSIGRMDNYKDGTEDKQAELDGLNLLQPVIYTYYKEVYSE